MGVRLGGSGKVGRNERRGALDSSGVDVDVAGLPASLRRALAVSAAAVFLSLSLAGPSQANFLFDTPDEKDPVEPFSVFGTVYKKYIIDVMDATGRQIVGRQKGFTAEACVDVIAASQQKFRVPGEGGTLARGGPTSAAVALAGATTGSFASTSTPAARVRFCEERVIKGTLVRTEEMLPACVPACRSACSKAIDSYDVEQRRAAGFALDAKDEAKVVGTCAARCAKECIKAGRAYDFIVPYRP